MSEFRIYTSEDGLVKTTVHGMGQDAFVVTEDKMNAFNSNSFDFQVLLALFSVALGVFLGSLNDRASVEFAVSAILSIFLLLASMYVGNRFRKIKKNLFIKPADLALDFVVVNAVYGSDTSTMNIKDRLQSMVKDGKLVTTVSNNIGGDPHPGNKKSLTISYRHNGQEYNKIFHEGDHISLP